MEKWIVFYNGKKELASYTLRGTFPGELRETAELLAYEKGINSSDIKVKIETR